MSSPAADAATPFRGGLLDAQPDDRTHVLAVARDYDNPWLARAMVTIGLRATSADLLDQFATDALACAPAESADAGAALCVQAYRSLERGEPLAAELLARLHR
jgi:hypothetical protein